MSTQGVRESPLRGYRRRKAVLNLDLNRVPPCENRDQEGTSSQALPPEVVVTSSQAVPPEVVVTSSQAVPPEVVGTSSQAVPLEVVVDQQPQSVLPTIDVEAIEDEVVESSARAFAEARSKARRNRDRVEVINVDSVHVSNTSTKRRREPPNEEIVFGDLYINLENNTESVRETEQSKNAPHPPPEPTFSCPICMGPLVHEMSTRCGHIFCKACIHAAIAAQNKCPTCRKKVTVKQLIRIFLPTTR